MKVRFKFSVRFNFGLFPRLFLIVIVFSADSSEEDGEGGLCVLLVKLHREANMLVKRASQLLMEGLLLFKA